MLCCFRIERTDYKPDEKLAYKETTPLLLTATRDPQNHASELYLIDLVVQNNIDAGHFWNNADAPGVQVSDTFQPDFETVKTQSQLFFKIARGDSLQRKPEAVLGQLRCEVHPPLSLVSHKRSNCHMCILYMAQMAS